MLDRAKRGSPVLPAGQLSNDRTKSELARAERPMRESYGPALPVILNHRTTCSS